MGADKFKGMSDHDLLIRIATKVEDWEQRFNKLEDEDDLLHGRITRLKILAAIITALGGAAILIITSIGG